MKYCIWEHIKPHYITINYHQVERLLHIMFSCRAALKFKRNVEIFKYLNLWQPFPQRFLAWHFPTCEGLFPAPRIMPKFKKMTAVFLWEEVSSAKTFVMILLRDHFIQTEVLTIVWSIRGPLLPGEDKDGDSPGIHWTESKNNHSIKFTFHSKVFGVISDSVRDQKHGYHQHQHRERWDLTKRSL